MPLGVLSYAPFRAFAPESQIASILRARRRRQRRSAGSRGSRVDGIQQDLRAETRTVRAGKAAPSRARAKRCEWCGSKYTTARHSRQPKGYCSQGCYDDEQEIIMFDLRRRGVWPLGGVEC